MKGNQVNQYILGTTSTLTPEFQLPLGSNLEWSRV